MRELTVILAVVLTAVSLTSLFQAVMTILDRRAAKREREDV